MVLAPKSKVIPQSTDITNPKVQTRVDNPEDIINVLLRQNFQQLLESQHVITSEGKMLDHLEWNTEGDLVDDLLQGLNVSTAGTITEGDKILANFISLMKYASIEDGKVIQEFKWKYGIDEYKATFSKTIESTACGPLGLHMTHWKAVLEREPIMWVHSFFVWVAFQFGFTYTRWEISWHCMLQ